QRSRREPLVASAVETERSMAANALNKVPRVREEHGVVFRNGTVPGIGQPEILPDDDAVTVAGFVEGVVADLADPIANHREVHFAVITHRGVIFARAITKHRSE